MNHAKGYSDITLMLFGGLVPEMAPRDLPEGASPLNQDVDYQIGSVFTRAGLSSVYSYGDIFASKNTRLGQSILGTQPNETPWTTPNNITVDSPGTYASVAFTSSIFAQAIGSLSSLGGWPGPHNGTFVHPVTQGNTLLTFVEASNGIANTWTIVDTRGNTWNQVGPDVYVASPSGHTRAVFAAANAKVTRVNITAASFSAGHTTYTYTISSGTALVSGDLMKITGMQNINNNVPNGVAISSLGVGTFTVVALSGTNESGSHGSGLDGTTTITATGSQGSVGGWISLNEYAGNPAISPVVAYAYTSTADVNSPSISLTTTGPNQTVVLFYSQTGWNGVESTAIPPAGFTIRSGYNPSLGGVAMDSSDNVAPTAGTNTYQYTNSNTNSLLVGNLFGVVLTGGVVAQSSQSIGGGFGTFDTSAQNHDVSVFSSSIYQTVGPATPVTTGEWAILGDNNYGGVFTPPGFTQVWVNPSFTTEAIQMMPLPGNSTVYWQNAIPQNLGGYTTNLLLFKGPSYPLTATVTSIQVSNNTVTCVCTGEQFMVGTQVSFTNLTHATFLNNHTITILTNTGTIITGAFTHTNYGPTVEPTGTATNLPYLQSGGLSMFGVTPPWSVTLPNPVTAGSILLVGILSSDVNAYMHFTSVSDGVNSYTIQYAGATTTNLGCSYQHFAWAQNVAAGVTTITVTPSVFNGGPPAYMIVLELPTSFGGPSTSLISQLLSATNFGLNLPVTTQPLGMSVEIDGLQTVRTSGDILTISLINPATNSPSHTFQLSTSQGGATVGDVTDAWGLTLTPQLLNDPNFGFYIQATGVDGVTFDVSAVKLTVWTTPTFGQDINYVKTFAQTGGEITTLILDASGTLWAEDVVNTPLVLNSIYTTFEPDTFAQSVTANNREYFALSDLINGTDMPRQWTGTWMDRLSQVGPGAPPIITSTSTGYPILATAGITQEPAINYTGLGFPYGVVLLSGVSLEGTASTAQNGAAGNVLTFYFRNAFTLPAYFKEGTNIVISNMPIVPGTNGGSFDFNNGGSNPPYYTIVGPVGHPPGATDNYVAFSVLVPMTGHVDYSIGPGYHAGGLTFQATQATVTTSTQVPNLEIGNQFQIAGTSVAGYDNTWTILDTPNASQLNITNTVLSGNVATYTYSIITGAAPVPGEFVTVTGTLNGNGIFNVGSAVVQSVSISTPTSGTFSIGIGGADVAAQAETGTGIIFGTEFVFDPLAILGDSNGGNIVSAGTIGAGIRKACVSFLSRNGYVSKPSPIATFDVTNGSSAIALANIAIGPDDTVARIISFTGANGGYFFNIPKPVTIVSNGVNIIETSTWINDNNTTSATFSFSDATLLAANSIDSQGNNWFNQKELGSCLGLISYAGRLFGIGEQNKVTNLLNWSFDGGTGNAPATATLPNGTTYPLGWTVDSTYGAGGSMTESPLFGNAYSIINSSGITQALYGMITQDAYEDEFQVPIIQAATTYSVRVTASSPNLTTVGNLVVDLFQPSSNTILGSFVLGLSHMSDTMGIFTGSLLPVPITPSAAPTTAAPAGTPFYAAGLVQHGATDFAIPNIQNQGGASQGQFGPVDTISFTYPNPVTAGNTLILVFNTFNYGIRPVVTDSKGNNWQMAVGQQTAGSEFFSYIYFVSGAIGGYTTVNIQEGYHNFNSFVTAVYGEFDGILVPASLDGTASSFYGGGTTGTINTGTVTTLNPNDVIISGYSQPGPVLATGFTLIDSVSFTAQYLPTEGYTAGYKVVSSPGTYTPSWPYTGASGGTGVTAVFKLIQQNAPAPIIATTAIPSDLLLRVYGSNLPTGAQILIDRVEPFPTEEPILTTQLTASYANNLEAFDEVSGVVDASVQNQQPITNAFTIFDNLYILKTNSLFSTEDNGTTEPNNWEIKEVSDRIGCCGIHAMDYGEEWVIFAHRTGLYAFFGGEPRKISQELQPLWDLINWAYGHTIWVRNDTAQRRILIGVPLATPNAWLPNAPVNTKPTTPNVILMMNYREINSVQDLVSEAPIHVTYANRIVAKDISRKWSVWNIISPYADFIERQDGSAPLFLCNGVGNSKIYQMLDDQLSDDGVAINSIYTTFGFVKQDFAQGMNIGQHRKLWVYLSMAVEGAGPMDILALPDQITSAYANSLGAVTLTSPVTDNLEIPLNETGTRLFIQFSTNAVGSWFSLQELTLTMAIDPWSPVRGL